MADPTAHRAHRVILTVDLTYHGAGYRLREDIRERSSIRPMPDHAAVACSGCDRVIRRFASYVQTPTLNLHPACAIAAGLMVLVGRSVETPSPSRATAEV